jgi:hypothetical protein
VEVLKDGTISALTPQGEDLIVACGLDRSRLTAYRRTMLSLIAMLRRKKCRESAMLLRHFLGFPQDVPRLADLKPPNGNVRPGGIATSAFDLRQRGELPETY